jgi:hypothetical protein
MSFPRYNVYLDWGDGWTAMHDFGGRDLVRQAGFSKDVSLHKDLSPVKDKASFTLDFVTSIANTLLTLEYDQVVLVDIDRVDGSSTTHWFYGYLRPVTSYDIDTDDRVIQMEALDNSWRLSRKPTASGRYINQRLDTVLTAILTAAGYGATERGGIPSLSQNVARVTWESYDDPWEKLLEELLFAFGYTYYFDEQGIFRVYSWIADTISISGTVNDSNILSRLTADRDDERVGIEFDPGAPADEIRISQYTTQTFSNVELISRSPNVFPVDLVYPPEVQTHSFGPVLDTIKEDANALDIVSVRVSNLSALSTWRFQKFTGDFRSTDKSFVHSGADGVLTTFTPDPSGLSVDIQFSAPGLFTGAPPSSLVNRILSYFVFGDLEVRLRTQDLVVSVPAGLAEDIKNPYFEAGTTAAQRVATELVARSDRAIYQYSFDSEDYFDIGDYLTVQSTDLNINTTARVISREHRYVDGVEIYSYKLEGAAEIGILFGSITLINGTQGATTAAVSSSVSIVSEGLNADGTIRKPISGGSISDTVEIDGDVFNIEPNEDGLFFNSTSMGFYDVGTSFWPVRIYNDGGTGKLFAGDSAHFIEWDGSDLTVKGAASIDGTITAGDGIQSSDYVAGSAGWRIDGDGAAEFDAANIRGTISATTGAIGGWDVTATALEATDDSVSIRSDLRRVEVRDAVDVTKVALGYLSSIADYDATDFGLYVGPGASVGFSSGAAFEDGDYLINSDAAFIAESGGVESVRLGSLGSGDIGLDIGGMKFGPLLGGGGATGTFEAIVSGGGGATGTFDPVSGGGGARFGTASGLLYSLADDRLYLTGTLVGVDGEFSGSLNAATGTFAGLVSGGSIDIGDGDFTVDSSGNVTAANIDITGGTISGSITATGTISGGTISGATITNGSNFTVDSSGSVVAGDISITSGSIDGPLSVTGDITLSGGDINAISGEILLATNSYINGNDLYMKAGTGTIFDEVQVKAAGGLASVEVKSTVGGTVKRVALQQGGSIYADLPTSAPGASGLMWRDASGYVRIT